MKSSIIPLLLLLCGISPKAFAEDLDKLKKEQRIEYLINLAKEVTLNFGPEWYSLGPTHAAIDDTLATFNYNSITQREEMLKNVGRRYYRIKFFYDKATKDKIIYSLASYVDIWADDGSPMRVIFGNNMGRHFFYINFWALLSTKNRQAFFETIEI